MTHTCMRNYEHICASICWHLTYENAYHQDNDTFRNTNDEHDNDIKIILKVNISHNLDCKVSESGCNHNLTINRMYLIGNRTICTYEITRMHVK